MTTAVATTTAKDIAKIQNQITEQIKGLASEHKLVLPPNYSYENAIKSAFLILQDTVDRNDKPALEVCTTASISNALLNMVVQGLSPVKKQCYFIVHGKKLTLFPSYFGAKATAKRLSNVEDVIANCIYEDDTFSYELDLDTGVKRITEHKQDFKNIADDKIVGAYCIVIRSDGLPNYVEIMNIDQIKKAWGMGQTKGNSKAHNNFPDQMAMRTVINRAVKQFVNTSDDNELLADAINKGMADDQTEFEIYNEEVAENANLIEVNIPDIEETEPQEVNTDDDLPELLKDSEDGPGF